jgi:UPF0755 protein
MSIQISKIIKNISTFLSLVVLLFLIVTVSLVMYFNAPNIYNTSDKKFIIESGLTFRQVVEKLHQEKIISNVNAFLYSSQLVKGINPTVRYGEYFFEKNLSYYKMMNKIIKGYISFRKITITEGLTTKSAIEAMNNSYGLIGDLPENVLEGVLLPETYFYSYNDTRFATLKRMKNAMQKTIDELWEQRDRSVPLKNKFEAIILASIVEKETGSASERGKVASVFVNRLKKGMKLQSDPTIIYSFTMGDKNLERVIRKSDINNKSLYNTYHIYGLPPTPICNPGIESIKAVLKPEYTDFLYFVASGVGGEHNFSKNIKDHNTNVAKYYKILRSRKSETVTDANPQSSTQPKVSSESEAL